MKMRATDTLTLYFIDDFTHYFYRQAEILRDGKLFGVASRLIFTVRFTVKIAWMPKCFAPTEKQKFL
jgi:hypothetical protein